MNDSAVKWYIYPKLVQGTPIEGQVAISHLDYGSMVATRITSRRYEGYHSTTTAPIIANDTIVHMQLALSCDYSTLSTTM
jgi:hypothetical protein